MTAKLDGSSLNIDVLQAIVAGQGVVLCDRAIARMARSRAVIERAVSDHVPVYGVTTGLGSKVTEALSEAEMDAFALATVRGRAHAVGEDLPSATCRAALAIRCNTLLTGGAGARPELAQQLAECLNRKIAPVIRSVGTIGAADLMQGADMGLAMIGEGRMYRADGSIGDAASVLGEANMQPFAPAPREGLALVSHSSVTAGLFAIAIIEASQALASMIRTAALSFEGFRANLSPLDPDVLAIHPQAGQAAVTADLREQLAGSALWHPGAARRLQDPLSFRNVPQVLGAFRAAIDQAQAAGQSEMNSAPDNPVVIVERGEILSHGGYLTPHMMVTMNAVTSAWSLAAAAQVARISRMLAARMTGLNTGLLSMDAARAGFGPVLKTAEALWAEMAHLASPPPIYIGFSADGVEDVSVQTALAAKSAISMAGHQRRLSAVEALIAAEAVDQRMLGNDLAPPLRSFLATLRVRSPRLTDDRPLAADIEAIAAMI